MAGSNKERQGQVQQLMYDELGQIETREVARKAKLEKEKADKEKEQLEKAQKEQLTINKAGYELVSQGADQEHERRRGQIGMTDDGKLDVTKGEAELRLLELQEDDRFLTAKLLRQRLFAQDSADTEAALTANHSQQVRLRADTERAYAEQMKQVQWALNDARRDAMAQGVEVLKSFLGEHTVAYKAATVAMKAFAIADVIVNMNREIAQIWANPTWSLLPDGGLAIKTATSTAAKIRAGVSIAGIAAQGIQELAAPATMLAKKDDGGFTGIMDLYGSPEGFYDRPTRVNAGRRSYIVGEKRKEFIMGGAMLEKPQFANLALALDAVQRRGDYGGLEQMMQAQTRNGGVSSAQGVTVVSDPAVRSLLQQLVSQPTLSERQSSVVLNYRLFEEYQEQVTQVRNDTSL